jgi:uncharacterized protein
MDENFHKARVAFNEGDYGLAFKLLSVEAENGNAQAQCLLGSMYQLGLGVPFRADLAVKWYLAAAYQGEPEGNASGLAFHNLATIFTVGGIGVAPDPCRAKLFLSEAIRLGIQM